MQKSDAELAHFRVVAVLFSSHPHMTDRIVELAEFVSSNASSDG
jgi:hypothetical protein